MTRTSYFYLLAGLLLLTLALIFVLSRFRQLLPPGGRDLYFVQGDEPHATSHQVL